METLLNNDAFDQEDLGNYASNSYLNYSMYVITNRSLPHVADGLKPVQRRILYSMNELNLVNAAKHKKSARTVGDTLGKYHPHGDSACYEAMVYMAQPFSTLHPLVDGQGNWGSIDDPKSFAAMRYTESKMTSYTESLLKDIKRGTVDWKLNFDGTLKEPKLFPAQLPNILINGATGIAVGMATDIPPHNMEEVVNACLCFLNNKKVDDETLLSHILGPDLPGGSEIITPKLKIQETYLSGRGKFTMRSSIERDDESLYVTSIPYRTSLSRIIESIDQQVKEKKLPVTRIKDLSDRKNPVKLQIFVKGKSKQDLVLNTLLACTDLEKTLPVNMNMIGLDGRPSVKSLPTILREWCLYRQSVFERKTNYRLNEINARLHLLLGFLMAYDNLDKVIEIVREEDNPREELMRCFSLSEIQAKAILELRLRQLAKLEIKSLQEEKENLEKEKLKIETILASDSKIKKEIISEIKQASKPHLKPRGTIVVEREGAKSEKEILKEVNEEPCTVVLSKNGWLRTIKGHDIVPCSLSFKTGDSYQQHLHSNYHLPTIIMGSQGRFFGIPNDSIANGKSMGEPATSKIELQGDEDIFHALPFNEKAQTLLVTKKGNGFITPTSHLDSRNKRGKQILVLTKGDSPLAPLNLLGEEKELALITAQGRLLVIPISEVKVSNKSQGVRLVDIRIEEFESGQDHLVAIKALSKGGELSVFVGNRKYNVPESEIDYYRCKRARRGVFFKKGKNLTGFG